MPAAIDALSRSLELDPRNVATLYHLALSYEKGGKREEARQALTRYLQMDPSSDRSAEVQRHLQALRH